ncbi:MAG: DUF4381 domain-containing protein [Neptuniibacter sp.]
MDFSKLPLRDMQLPEAISWWPLAPGWWLLMCLLVVFLIAVFFTIWKKLQDPRREAMQELLRIEQQYSEHQDKQLLVVECNTLMKRLALTLYPRSQVAALSGQQWLAFLRNSSGKLDISHLDILIHGPYQASVELSSDDLIQSCRQWIKQVRGSANV